MGEGVRRAVIAWIPCKIPASVRIVLTGNWGRASVCVFVFCLCFLGEGG